MTKTLAAVFQDRRKNYLGNSGFDIWQRGGDSATPGGQIAVPVGASWAYRAQDRWQNIAPTGGGDLSAASTESSYFVNQLGLLPNNNTFARKALRFSSTHTGPNGSLEIRQFVEGIEAAELRGTRVSLGVWVLSGSATEFTMRIGSSSTIDSFSGQTIEISQTSNIVADSTWQYLSIDNFDISTFTNAITNGLTIDLYFTQFDTNGTHQHYIAQPVLQQGGIPGRWQRMAGTYSQEIYLMQRYYEKSYNIEVPLGTVTNTGAFYWVREFDNSDRDQIWFKVPKRANASVVSYSPLTGTFGQYMDASAVTDRAAGSFLISNTTLIQDQESSGWVALPQGNVGRVHWAADSEIT